jgi:hypothetical protein
LAYSNDIFSNDIKVVAKYHLSATTLKQRLFKVVADKRFVAVTSMLLLKIVANVKKKIISATINVSSLISRHKYLCGNFLLARVAWRVSINNDNIPFATTIIVANSN